MKRLYLTYGINVEQEWRVMTRGIRKTKGEIVRYISVIYRN